MHTNMATLEVALQCGFSSSSYFARCFQREFGLRPSEVRRDRR
jgi:AraC family L-rhamnose operon regulatory protein RhaS